MTAHVSRSIGSGSPWSSPEDALLADGVAASARVFMSSSSSLLLVSDFRLGVPAAATLRGVVVAVVRKGGEVIDASLQLSVDGAPSGEDRRGLAAHHDDGHVLRVTNARHDASPSEPAGGAKSSIRPVRGCRRLGCGVFALSACARRHVVECGSVPGAT